MTSAERSTLPIVDVDWVAARAEDEDVRVIEVDVAAAAYDGGHLPDALLWNVYRDLRRPDYSPISTEELEQLLERSGIGDRTTVVFYGYAAHLGYWLLTSHGHERTLVLDGRRDEWHESGRAWSRKAPPVAPAVHAPLRRDARLAASREDVLASIDATNCVILDVRSQAEHDGERFWPSGAAEDTGRPGRIPGSVHLPIERLRTPEGRYPPLAELRAALADAGVAPDRRIVTYCTVGNRAAQAWFALRHLLDYPDCGVYGGSWAEWGFRADAPVECAAEVALR